MFKIACLKQCLFRTGKFEEEDKLKVVKVVSLEQVILNTVVLRAGLAQMITDYICTVMINWTVSSENCDKGFFFRYYHFAKYLRVCPDYFNFRYI